MEADNIDGRGAAVLTTDDLRLAAISRFHEDDFGGDRSINDRLCRNAMFAQNILRDELYDGSEYELTEDVRNRLIALARQDAAHALINTVEALRRLDRIEKRQRRALWFIPIIVLACVAVAFGPSAF
jgi:hypothetical protein